MLVLFSTFMVKAQNPSPKGQLMISNDTLLDSKNYQFDVYLRAKDTTVGTTSFTSFNLKGFQGGFQDSIKNIKGTGTVTSSVVPNSSNMGSNPDQRPTTVLIKVSTTNPLYVQINPMNLTTNGMTLYDSTTDPLANSGWVRVCTVKLTNSVDFLQAPLHLFFSKSSSYPNSVMANYSNPLPSNGQIIIDTLRSNWVNPIINKSLTIFTVSNTGSTVTLSGSESGGGITSAGFVGGVVYYLYKDASTTPYATATGTGASISWTNLPGGTYTVQAHRSATYIYTNMNGSAIIGSLTAHIVSGGGSYCQGATGQTVGLDNSDLGVNYQLLQGGIAYGAIKPGTGSVLNWTNLPAGLYTVQASQGATNLMMNGSANVIMISTPSSPIVSVTDNCNGTSTLTASGYTGNLLWNTTETTSLINVTSAGTYTVTQTLSGCTSLAGSGVASPKSIPATPTVNVQNNCGNSVLSTTATGILLWSTNENTSSITVNIAGIFSVTETVNGCMSLPGSGTASPAAIPTTPIISVVNDCGYSVLTITNPVSGASFEWSDLGTDNPHNVTSSGTFTVTQAIGTCISGTGSGTASPMTPPPAPTGLACYQTATFNNATCQWVVTGTQPIHPTGLACYQTATFNNTTCQWDITGTQPTQPTGLACYQTSTWNGTTCQWDVTGTQPPQPTSLACYQTSTWNGTTCQWDVTGTQPAQPTGLACYQTTTWNGTTCQWDVTGTQPLQPTGLACYQTSTWNGTTCQWDVTGTQPSQPTGLACYQTSTWNGTTCQWDITGTPTPAPTVTAVANCGSTTLTASNFTGTLLWSTNATTTSITVFDGNVYSVTQSINGCESTIGSGSATPKSIPSAPVVTVQNYFGYSILTTTASGSLLWSNNKTTSKDTVNVAGTYSVTTTVDGCTSQSGSAYALPITGPPQASVMITNDTLLDPKNYQFEVWVKAKVANGNTSFNLKGFQAGISQTWANIKGSGLLSVSVVSGSSQFGTNPDQRPTVTLLRPSTTNPNYIQLNPASLQSNGMTIDTNWVRACTIKITDTSAFAQGTPNINFSSVVTYPTTIMANYPNPNPANGTIVKDSILNTVNPILNGIIIAYNVTNIGSLINLSNSQVGLLYQLKRNGVIYGSSVMGTGSALQWASLPVGSYTITAHRRATYMYLDMNGTGTIVPNVNVYNVSGGGNYCQDSTGLSVILANSQTGVSYQLLKDGSSFGTTKPGTDGVAINWTGLYTGTYTVHAIYGDTTLMNGNVVVTQIPTPATPTITVTQNCNVGTTTLTASNYSGSLLWSNAGTTPVITVSLNGTYTLEQIINGCPSKLASAVAIPTSTPATPVVTVANNCANSVLSTTATGTLLWSTAASTSSITVYDSNIYSVTTTINGCTSLPGSNTSTPKVIPSIPVVTVQDNCGNSVLSTIAVGTLLWTPGNATTSSITVTSAGTYNVTATINGCTSQSGSGIATPKIIPSTPVVNVVNNCNNTSTLSTTATGTLLWNTSESTSPIVVTSAGTYTVTQTAVNGCVSPSGSGVANPHSTPATPVVSVVDNCGSSLLSTTAPATLTWSTGVHTSSITVPTAGSYTVTSMNTDGCISLPGSGTATPKLVPNTPQVSVTNNCGNSVLSTSGVGGVSPYTYLWSNSSTNTSITILSGNGGSYSVTVTGSNGCTSPAGSGLAAPIAIPSAPVVTVTNNCTNTDLSTNAAGSLLWSNGALTSSINVTIAATYTVTTTVNGCISPSGSGTSAPKPIPSAPTVSVQNNCGNSVLTAGNITTGATLYWLTGAATNSITVYNASTYTLTQTLNGCTSTAGSGVSAPKAVPAVPVITSVNNCGFTTFSTTAPGPIYQWTTGESTSSINEAANNKKDSLRQTNSVGCTSNWGVSPFSAPKVIPSAPSVSVVDNCDNTSTLSTTASGALLWNTNETTPSIIVTTPGLYSVTTTLNGCISPLGSGTATPKSIPVTPVVTVQNTYVYSILTTTASGSLLWSNNKTTSKDTVYVAGNYSVTSTINGCTSLPGSAYALPITGPPQAVVMINNDTLLDSKNYQFDVWVKNKVANGNMSFNLKGLQAGISEAWANIKGTGTFTVSVVSGSSQFGTNPDQRPTTSIFRPSTTNPNFIQINPVALQTNGMTIDTNWVKACSIKLTNSVDFAQGTTNLNFSSNTLYPTIIMANYPNPIPSNGSISKDSIVNVVNPILNGTIIPYTVSNIGSVINLSNSQIGLLYQLKKGGIIYGDPIVGTGTSLQWTGLPVGAYTVTAHRKATYMYLDMTGTGTIVSNVIVYNISGGGDYCQDSIGLTVTLANSQTGVSYQLIKDGVNFGTVKAGSDGSLINWTGLLAGTYTVQAIYGIPADMMNGSVVINQISTPVTPTITVTQNCSVGTTTLTASNYTGSLLWSNAGTTPAITVSLNGTYTLKQIISGCPSKLASAIAIPTSTPATPIVTVVNNCANSVLSTTATGTLLWSNTASTSSITVYDTNTYYVTTTINGCTSLAGSNISNPKKIPSMPIVTVQDNCGNSVLSTTSTGTLLWTPGNAATSSITVTSAGTYNVTATINGCTSPSGSGIATPKIIPSTPIVNVVNNCNNTSTLSTTATGTLLWSTTESTSSIVVTSAGTYTVTQTAVNGCVSPSGSGVANPHSTPATPVVSVVDNCGSSVLSTTAPATLTWSTGVHTSSITVSTAGAYTVTSTNTDGCVSLSGSGTANPKLVPATPVVSVSNNCGNSVLSTSGVGGVSPYTYLWSNTSTNTSITILSGNGGSYSVTVTGFNGCTSPSGSGLAAPITIPAAPVVTVTNNCANTDLSTNAAGSLLWSNGATTSAINVTNAATYTVTTTVAGCISPSGSGTSAPKSIPVAPTVSVVNNCGNSVLTASNYSGGTLYWLTGAATVSITVFNSSVYTVTTTVNGCTSSTGSGTSAPKAVPAVPVITAVNNCGFTAFSTTAPGPIYQWTTGESTSSINEAANNKKDSLRQTNSVGCVSNWGVSSFSAPKKIPATPIVSKTDNCNNTSTLSTSSTSGNLLWSNGAITSTTIVATAGTYTVTRDTTNGCISPAASIIASPRYTPATPVITVQNNCAKTSILTISNSDANGPTYHWNTNAVAASITVHDSAQYSLIQTYNGCPSLVGLANPKPKVDPVTPLVSNVNVCMESHLTITNPVSGATFAWLDGGTDNPHTVSYNYVITQNHPSIKVTQTSTEGCTSAASANIYPVPVLYNTRTIAISSNQSPNISAGTNLSFLTTTTIANPDSAINKAKIKWYKNSTYTNTSAATYSFIPVNNDAVQAHLDSSYCNSSATSNIIIVTVRNYVTNTWNGSVSTNWHTASNWSLGMVPNDTMDVVIPPIAPNYPTISSPCTIHNLKIEQNTTGVSSTLIDNGNELTLNGSTEVQCYLNVPNFHYIASPVTDALTFALNNSNPDNAGSTTYLKEYNPLIVSSNPYIMATQAWTDVPTNISQVMVPGKGYEARTTASHIIKLRGTHLNSTDLALTSLVYAPVTPSSPANLFRYNLVGNPFPAALNVVNFYNTWPRSNINSVLYIWNGSQYITFNGFNNSGTGPIGTAGPRYGKIPVFQSFMVVATGTNPSFTIPASAKTTSSQYYKASVAANQLRLNINGNGYEDEALISFDANFTKANAELYNAQKIYGISNAPQLYSMITDQILTVNTLSKLEGSVVVPMGLEVGANAAYTISASELNSFAYGTTVILEDVKMNVFTDLTVSPSYSFKADPGDDPARFKVHFSAPNSVANNSTNSGNINIYANNNNIYISNNGIEKVKEIVVYDMLGKELVRKVADNNNLNKISINDATAFYLVKVTTDKKVYTQKVFIK